MTPVTAVDAGRARVGTSTEVLLLTTCVLANFMAYGTFAAFNVAVPAMSRDLAGGVSAASWMVLAFLLAMSSTTLIFARLTDQLGRRWFYFGGIVVYAASSVVCLASTNDAALLVMRAVQGAAAAASMATSTAVLADVFPARRLPTAMGLFMSLAGASAVFGPMLGGVLIDRFGWRSIFWASVAFGGLAIVTGWDALKHVHKPRPAPFHFDVPGAATSVVGICALVYGVQSVGGPDWSRMVVVSCVLISLGALALFAAVERASPQPLVDLSVVTGPRAGLYLSSFGTGMSANGLVVMIPLQLPVMGGFTAAAAGAFLLPMGVMMLLGAPLSGLLQRWTSARTLTTWGGLAIGGPTLVVAALVALDQPRDLIWPLLLVSGLGQGIYQASLSGRLMAGVTPNRRGIANGARSTLINASTALSTAFVIAMVSLLAGEHAIREAASEAARPGFAVAGAILGALGLAGAHAAWAARPEAETGHD